MPCTANSTARGTDPGPSIACGSTGWATDQARVVRLSARLHEPSVASSPAATSPSAATAGRRSGSRPSRGRTTPAVGRETRACTSAVNFGSGSEAYWISFSPRCRRRRGGSCSAVRPPRHRGSPGSVGLGGGRASVMYAGMPVSSLLARSPGPCQTNQPSPIARMIAATTARTPSRTWWCSAASAQDRDEPWAPSIAASTKHRAGPRASPRCRAAPTAVERERDEESAGGERGDRRDQPATSTGIRVARGISASTASTTSSAPSHHGPPTSLPKRPTRRSVKPREVGLTSGLHEDSERSRATAPAATTGGSTGSRQATRGGPRWSGRAAGCGDGHRERREHDGQHRPRRPRPRGEGRGHGEEQAGAPGGAPATVGLGVGEAERRVGDPRHQDRGHDHTEPAVAPGAGGDRHQGVGDGAERDQPARRAAGSTSRPTTRSMRQAPHRASGTASSSSAETAAGRCRSTEPRIAIGATYAGAGTPVPVPSGCHARPRAPQRLCVGRRRRQSPPVTSPNASRTPMIESTTTTLRATASGLVKNRATRPVSSATASSSSDTTTGRRSGAGQRSLAARVGRRRPAPGWSRPRRCHRRSRACRYGTTRARAAAGSCSRTLARLAGARISPGLT